MAIIKNSDLLSSTVMYDTYHDHISKIAKDKAVISQLIKFIGKIKMKNNDTFETYYIGRRLSINAREWAEFWNIVGLNEKDVADVARGVPRLKEVNQKMDQFVVAVILILLTGELISIGNENAARFIYLFAYFKPYASRVTQIFKIVPNEETIETMMNNISNRFDLKKEQSLFGCLKSMSTNSFDGILNGRPRKEVLSGRITDNELWITFESTIWTSIMQFLTTIFKAHDKYKNMPTRFTKDLELEDDDGTSVIDTSNGEIDAKNRMVSKVIRQFTINPIDDRLVRFAINRSGLYAGNDVSLNQLKTVISRCLDNDQQKCCALFGYLISAFLNTVDKYTNKKYTVNELRSAIFSAKIYGIIYDTRNTIDPNKIEAKNIVMEMLEKYLDEFEYICKTYKDQYRKAFVLYCAAYIQKNG